MIVERTGFSTELAAAAVGELARRGVVTDAGGGFYKAAQVSCPGNCWRGGHELRGQEIVITPPGFELVVLSVLGRGEGRTGGAVRRRSRKRPGSWRGPRSRRRHDPLGLILGDDDPPGHTPAPKVHSG